MFSGMVALEVAVENANAMTETNFFKNVNGLTCANTLSKIM